MNSIAEAMTKALQGYVRWVLALLAFVSLLVAAGVGIPLGFVLFKLFAWPAWFSSLPGAGFALLVACFAFWASQAARRPIPTPGR